MTYIETSTSGRLVTATPVLKAFSDWSEDTVYDGCPNCGGSPCVCIPARCCGMPIHPDEGGSCSWCGNEGDN